MGEVVVDDGRVAVAEPEGGVAFPGVGEAADLVQGGDVVAVVGEEVERAAGGDRGELGPVPHEQHLRAGLRGRGW